MEPDNPLIGSTAATPPEKFALVIGNSYSGTAAVSGTVDAQAIAKALEELSFSVIGPVLDARADDIKDALKALRERIRTAKAVVFFFSGHGYQINGTNYLLPFGSPIDPKNPQVSLDKVLRSLSGAPDDAAKIVLLDACRSSASIPTTAGELKDVEGWKPGLEQPPSTSPPRTLFSYAADFGRTALSRRPTEISYYTEALLSAIREPGLEIRPLLDRVHDLVLFSTGNQQSTTSVKLAEFAETFYFRKPVEIQVAIDKADDDLFLVLNGRIVRGARRDEIETANGVQPAANPLPLKARENELLLLVSKQKVFHNLQSWSVPEGWSYRVTISHAEGKPIKNSTGVGGVISIADGEPLPFKAGPHHGQLFEAARVVLRVDPTSAELSLEHQDTELWNDQAPVWARDQEVLFEQRLADLDLGDIFGLGDLTQLVALVNQLLGGLEPLIGPIKIPDLSKMYGLVCGHRSFREAVRVSMVDRRADRIEDLKKSIDAIRARHPRPFDSFDQALSESVWQVLSADPQHPFKREDVRIWTAFEERP